MLRRETVKKKNCYNMLPLVVFFYSIFVQAGYANDTPRQLIVSEAYLNVNNTKANWVELYNPTSSDLVFGYIRTATSRTMPYPIMNEDGSIGITVKAGKTLVLCANESHFIKKWGVVPDLHELKMLNFMNGQGDYYMFMTGSDEKNRHVYYLGYGEPRSGLQRMAREGINTVISQTSQDKSINLKHVRNAKNSWGVEISDSIPTPGKF